VLVLTVQETKPFFYLIDAVAFFDPQDGPLSADEDSRGATSENLALGFRWFVGRRGAVHVGLSGIDHDREFAREYGAFSVGYTQYDLFGSRAFATLNLRYPIDASGKAALSPQLVVGVPLAANQTVTMLYDELHTGAFAQRLVTARWSYNTTNEPFFPTRGSHVYAGPVAGWIDGTPRGNPYRRATHSNFLGVEGGAARYFELSERDSVWTDLRAEWARNDYRDPEIPEGRDQSTRYGSIGAGYSHSLWSREERANGDSRFEITARYSRRSRSLEERSVVFTAPDRNVTQVGAAWVRRSSWGTVRLGVGYAW
jgi:hypothetical protein